MQILQGAGGIAGARGWVWRVVAAETHGRRASLLHLAREHRAGTTTLTAVRGIEPLARIAPARGLTPAPAATALAVVELAAREARRALTVAAARRLHGDVHAWQLAAAVAFERGHARVLLADSVGMGKTASAAIAIAQCIEANRDARCLVLCPGHLLAQWREELRCRMGIDAPVVDAPWLRRMLREIPAGVSPWEVPGCRLASLDFIKQAHVARALEALVLDMLVIDEAHLACGASDRHALADMLARRARRLLLLTATPSDGGGDRARALMSLGAAGDAIVTLRHEPPDGAPRAIARTLWLPAHPAVAELHDALGDYTRWIASGPRHGDPALALLGSLLVKRALSSPRAVQISLARRLSLLEGEPAFEQPSLFEIEDDPGVLGAASGRPAGSERLRLAALVTLSAGAARHDRRVSRLEQLLRRTSEPVVIFSCFRDTAAYLAQRLARRFDARLVHGQLPQAGIDAALGAFVDGPARVLIATDVASQGLNLHARCRWVIHYDLPWRPSTLRQRNGRVDRLGQMRRPHATMLLDRTTLSLRLVRQVAALGERMRADDVATAARWRVLALAEARRVLAERTRDVRSDAVRARFPDGGVTVVEMELLDAGGACLERAVIPLVADEAAAHEWTYRLASRRARALAVHLAACAARRVSREQAVAEAACETIVSTRVQQGLFERRAERQGAAAAETRQAIADAARDAVRRHEAQGRVACVRVRTVATFRVAAETMT